MVAESFREQEIGMNNNHRTALLLRCSEEESKLIHEAANRERRTISAFLLNAAMNHINAREKAQELIRSASQPRAKAQAASS